MQTLTVVKEPIHNYIAVSKLEAELLRDPLFQRLHNVSQNGTAYLTYPSNRTSRFVHSLGAMHVGGQMFRSAFFCSERDVRQNLAECFEELINIAAQQTTFSTQQLRSHLSNSNDVFYRHIGFDPENRNSAAPIAVLQSVRIACVLHDVGHPPFSHTVEAVLNSKLKSYVPDGGFEPYDNFVATVEKLGSAAGGQLHELVGTKITEFVLSRAASGRTTDEIAYGRFCFWLANRIVNPDIAEVDPRGIFQCLHHIVSRHGFDSDRADYVLRDGYASSFDYGKYDLQRIIDNLRFTHNQTGFELVCTTTALSALESFFLERYRIWRWLVFHHSVMRGHIALSRSLSMLFDVYIGARDSPEILAVLEQHDFDVLWRPFSADNTYPQYVACDEHWLMRLLRKVQELPLLNSPAPRDVALLSVHLCYVLDRNKRGFRTLWKRGEEYEEFCAEAYACFVQARQTFSTVQRRKLAKVATQKGESATQWFNRVIMPLFRNRVKSNGELAAMEEIERRFNELLQSDAHRSGALVLAPLHAKTDIDCPIVDKQGAHVDISALSSIVGGLASSWSEDIQLRAYWVGLHQSNGDLWQADVESVGPTRKAIAKCVLTALLGGEKWKSLKQLIEER